MKTERIGELTILTPESMADREVLQQHLQHDKLDPGREYVGPLTLKAGESSGHPFRGNQYTTGESGGSTEPTPPGLSRIPNATAAALLKLTPEMRQRFYKVYEIVTGPDFATHDTKTNFFNPQTGQYTPERQAAHERIIQDIMTASQDVPAERQAIIMGGLGGSGKSSLLRAGIEGTPYEEQRITDLNGQATTAAALLGVQGTGAGSTREEGARITNYVNVNADDIKERLINAGLAPKVEGLSPMETAPLLHEESSDVAHEVAQRLIGQGKNLIYDITLGSQTSGTEKITQLHDHGYKVTLTYVKTPVDHAVSSAIGRWSRGATDYSSGKGQGGRFVNPDIMQAARDGTQYTSRNEAAFYSLIGNPDPSLRPDSYFLIDNTDYRRTLIAKG